MRLRVLKLAAAATAGSALVCATASAAGGPPTPVSTNGAAVEIVATGLHTPTSFAFGAGKVFEGDFGSEKGTGGGGVYVLSNGTATLVPGSPAHVQGLTWHKKTLYVSAGNKILAWSHWNGTRFTKSRKVISIGSRHFTGFNGLGFGANGRLYAGVDVGNYDHSFSNKAPYLQEIISMTAKGKKVRVVARGIRQPWQLAFPRGSSRPYVSDLGADAGKVKNPPDFILRVKPGQDYGFPRCDWTKPAKCSQFAKPFQRFAPHSSPMGLGIIGKRLYISEFGGGPNGTGAVVSIPRSGGKPKTLLTGFVAPVVGLGTHKGWVYVGEVGLGMVFRVHS